MLLSKNIDIRGGSYIVSIVTASVACFCVYEFGLSLISGALETEKAANMSITLVE